MREKIEAIGEKATIYNIVFRNAGVAFQFFEGPLDEEGFPDKENWRNGLKIYKYYPTLEDAVNAEYERLCTTN